MDLHEFRKSVDAAAAHLAPDHRGFAVAYHVRMGRVARSQVADCVQLAGWYAEQEHSPAGDSAGPVRAAPLPETPLGTFTGDEWVRLLTPRVALDRTAIWGAPDPPWKPSQWTDGVAWLEEEQRRARLTLGIPEGGDAPSTPELEAVNARIGEDVQRLGEILGRPIILSHPWPHVVLMRFKKGTWQRTVVYAAGSPALRRIARLCDEVEGVTGFLRHETTAWVLFGTPPRFERAYIERTDYATIQIPGQVVRDGEVFPNAVEGTSVTVTFRSPDVTNEDLRLLREHVQRSWRTSTGPRDAEDTNARFTARDRALLVAWRQAGGPTGRRGATFWSEVRDLWQAMATTDPTVPPPPTSGEACRRYWYLFRDKANSGILDHLPIQEEY